MKKLLLILGSLSVLVAVCPSYARHGAFSHGQSLSPSNLGRLPKRKTLKEVLTCRPTALEGLEEDFLQVTLITTWLEGEEGSDQTTREIKIKRHEQEAYHLFNFKYSSETIDEQSEGQSYYKLKSSIQDDFVCPEGVDCSDLTLDEKFQIEDLYPGFLIKLKVPVVQNDYGVDKGQNQEDQIKISHLALNLNLPDRRNLLRETGAVANAYEFYSISGNDGGLSGPRLVEYLCHLTSDF